MAEATAVRIERDRAIDLMKWCGWKSSGKLSNSRIAQKLLQVPEVAPKDTDSEYEPPSEEVSKTLLEVQAAIESKAAIEVYSEGAGPEDDVKNTTEDGTENKTEDGTENKTEDGTENKKLKRIRPGKTSSYCCGEVFKKFGLEEGVTDEMIQAYNEIRGKKNDTVAEANLVWAWHVVNGYLNGAT